MERICFLSLQIYIIDSRLKYIYSPKLHGFNMDWYTGIGIEQLSNCINVSFLWPLIWRSLLRHGATVTRTTISGTGVTVHAIRDVSQFVAQGLSIHCLLCKGLAFCPHTHHILLTLQMTCFLSSYTSYITYFTNDLLSVLIYIIYYLLCKGLAFCPQIHHTLLTL